MSALSLPATFGPFTLFIPSSGRVFLNAVKVELDTTTLYQISSSGPSYDCSNVASACLRAGTSIVAPGGGTADISLNPNGFAATDLSGKTLKLTACLYTNANPVSPTSAPNLLDLVKFSKGVATVTAVEPLTDIFVSAEVGADIGGIVSCSGEVSWSWKFSNSITNSTLDRTLKFQAAICDMSAPSCTTTITA